MQTLVDQRFTRVFKFPVDGIGDGFFNALVVSALQVHISRLLVH